MVLFFINHFSKTKFHVFFCFITEYSWSITVKCLTLIKIRAIKQIKVWCMKCNDTFVLRIIAWMEIKIYAWIRVNDQQVQYTPINSVNFPFYKSANYASVLRVGIPFVIFFYSVYISITYIQAALTNESAQILCRKPQQTKKRNNKLISI